MPRTDDYDSDRPHLSNDLRQARNNVLDLLWSCIDHPHPPPPLAEECEAIANYLMQWAEWIRASER